MESTMPAANFQPKSAQYAPIATSMLLNVLNLAESISSSLPLDSAMKIKVLSFHSSSRTGASGPSFFSQFGCGFSWRT
jgi:hypothetical protein